MWTAANWPLDRLYVLSIVLRRNFIINFYRKFLSPASNRPSSTRIFVCSVYHNRNSFYHMFGRNALCCEHRTGPSTSPQSSNSMYLRFIMNAHWGQITLMLQFAINRCNEPALKTIVDETKKLKADLIEVSLLETLILCRKGTHHLSIHPFVLFIHEFMLFTHFGFSSWFMCLCIVLTLN